MTATVSLVLILRRNLDVRQQVAMQDVLDNDTLAGARRLTLFIIGMTALLEIAGAAALTLAWRGRFASCGIAAYHAVFHAISAFCNAGFSTFSENLMGFRGDIVTNAVVCLLIVGGGLGFTVVKDLGENLRARAARGAARLTRLRVQTRIVLAVTAILIVAGALLLYVVEAGGAFKGWSERDKVLASVFQSVTARTAGYNTCDIGALSPASQFTLIVLMFIGASPGGTGGGIKTTTVVALWAIVFSLLLGRDHAQIHRRTVPVEIVLKAVTVLCISLALVLVFAGVLMYTEKADPLAVLFETVSAFGTVGLSMGITPSLTPAGKLLITLMMFIGRLGPLTMAYALAFRRRPAKYEYAEERMMIG
jgi:trk system potassium uptake protein TrkH